MKVTAIISEYNPYTKGHAYLLGRVKEELAPDYVISVMSGCFVQRGECAMWDKYTRTRMALTCGMDMVIELPFAYATGSAFDFATGAVNLINSLKTVDTIAFGAETTDSRLFDEVSDILITEPSDFRESLRSGLSNGLSFPKARQRAILSCIKSDLKTRERDLAKLLSSPNNILALEYISALKRTGSQTGFHIIERCGSAYSDEALSESSLNSALSIRNRYTESGIADIAQAVPEECAPILKDADSSLAPITCDMLDSYLAYCVAMTDSPRDIYGFTDGISGRYTSLVKASSPVTFKGFAEDLHTKDTTLASVKRALLHLIAGYTESDRKLFAGNHDLSYASVLGARKCAGELIKAVTEASSVPVITKKSEAIKKLRASENAEALLRLWSLDVKTTALYNSLICSAYKTAADNVYSAPLIMI